MNNRIMSIIMTVVVCSSTGRHEFAAVPRRLPWLAVAVVAAGRQHRRRRVRVLAPVVRAGAARRAVAGARRRVALRRPRGGTRARLVPLRGARRRPAAAAPPGAARRRAAAADARRRVRARRRRALRWAARRVRRGASDARRGARVALPAHARRDLRRDGGGERPPGGATRNALDPLLVELN